MKTNLLVSSLAAAVLLLADSGAGLKWTAPAPWKQEAARPMRLATYTIAPVAGDKDNAECGVYYFGVGQGGTVQANLDRWIGQFESKDPAKVDKKIIHGVRVTIVDVSGTYSGMGGPRGPQGPPKTGYRLLGAIAEGSQGSIFFKFTGPAKTIAHAKPDFDKLLSSLAPE